MPWAVGSHVGAVAPRAPRPEQQLPLTRGGGQRRRVRPRRRWGGSGGWHRHPSLPLAPSHDHPALTPSRLWRLRAAAVFSLAGGWRPPHRRCLGASDGYPHGSYNVAPPCSTATVHHRTQGPSAARRRQRGRGCREGRSPADPHRGIIGARSVPRRVPPPPPPLPLPPPPCRTPLAPLLRDADCGAAASVVVVTGIAPTRRPMCRADAADDGGTGGGSGRGGNKGPASRPSGEGRRARPHPDGSTGKRRVSVSVAEGKGGTGTQAGGERHHRNAQHLQSPPPPTPPRQRPAQKGARTASGRPSSHHHPPRRRRHPPQTHGSRQPSGGGAHHHHHHRHHDSDSRAAPAASPPPPTHHCSPPAGGAVTVGAYGGARHRLTGTGAGDEERRHH
ncbi:hypothetical protein I4F81_007536 [Pyropia yezoensis]|uniref:Uncharacterized protein n=1 Tax=Pyropia yezoensis TaxID=2788 RepID=A0ACC3C4G0_PYRYE|nr:hypothetical protein I4F81_007536 [Neopyropia yezoensis]